MWWFVSEFRALVTKHKARVISRAEGSDVYSPLLGSIRFDLLIQDVLDTLGTNHSQVSSCFRTLETEKFVSKIFMFIYITCFASYYTYLRRVLKIPSSRKRLILTLHSFSTPRNAQNYIYLYFLNNQPTPITTSHFIKFHRSSQKKDGFVNLIHLFPII